MNSCEVVFNLPSMPATTSVFFWCDYIELCCLTSLDKTVYIDNFIEIKQELSDLQDDIEKAEMEEYSEFEIQGESVFPEIDDRQIRAMQDRFGHLLLRQDVFGDKLYPFEVSEDCIKLKKNMKDTHFLYIQLLASSALKYIRKPYRQDLTEGFEKLCLNVFKLLLPTGCEVFGFGKQQSKRYTGHLYNKLNKLAQDIRGVLTVKKKNFHANDYGDGGLDLVAWHPMGDDRELIPIAFAQCGCSSSPREFEAKMMQASPAKLGSCLHVAHPWANYYFMPQSLHDEYGWQHRSDIGCVIVVDRLRIMRIAEASKTNIASIINLNLVKKICNQRAELF